MKKKTSITDVLSIFILFSIFIVIYIYKNDITKFIMINVVYKKEMVILDANQYEKTSSYEYVQRTENYEPENKQELLNILFTILNKGWDEFSFYCPMNYDHCMDDLDQIIDDNNILSDINNFVHPFNSFERIYISKNSFGRIQVEVEKTYSDQMIEEINQKADEILKEIIKDDMNDKVKIKTIHDYIINHTSYDEEHAHIIETHSNKQPTYLSNTAYGTLIDGKAICGGYSDAMAVFLNRLGIDNYKISSSNHVWNYVKLDGKWYHLDLTWDDPVVPSGRNVLLHNFFLINTEELREKDTSQHTYNLMVYQEQ